uniref:Uncharacterized protein n=1 Tax=Lygus hesperus TaxID=30085 RepID=A0A146LDB3_LYGHE
MCRSEVNVSKKPCPGKYLVRTERLVKLPVHTVITNYTSTFLGLFVAQSCKKESPLLFFHSSWSSLSIEVGLHYFHVFGLFWEMRVCKQVEKYLTLLTRYLLPFFLSHFLSIPLLVTVTVTIPVQRSFN